jgi:HEPN domain-containing protein
MGKHSMKGNKNDTIPWIIKGDHDLGTALLTFLHIPEYKDTVTFHCQQAVEKYLKSYLIFLGTEFKFSHDLIYLLDQIYIEDKSIRDYYESILELQNYAVEVRYPDDSIFLTDEKVVEAIETAKIIRDFLTKKMGIDIGYNSIIDSELPKPSF